MAKITKTFTKAGSLPGQYQRLSISFVSRSGNSVKIKYELYVKSLGYDYYTYSERHNRFSIIWKGAEIVSKTYQLYGANKEDTFSGTVTLNNISNTDDDLVFYYQNQRVWASKTNSWDPRSTGVVKKTSVGTLSIPTNKQYIITFDTIVKDKIYTYKCYKDNQFIVPSLKPTSHYFDFKGWTSVDYVSDKDKPKEENIPNSVIEKATVNTSAGKKITVTKNLDYYGVWRPKLCNYKFYDYNGKLIKDFSTTHKWGTSSTLPNLDTKSSGKYSVPGYTFLGWTCKRTNNTNKFYSVSKLTGCKEWPLSSATTIDVKFYAKDKAKNNRLVFHLSDSTSYIQDYVTDTLYNIDTVLSNNNLSAISIKPGYKLVGWSTVPLEEVFSKETSIAQPNEAFNGFQSSRDQTGDSYYIEDYNNGDIVRIYPLGGSFVFNYDDFVHNEDNNINELHLYPYYEFYTTCYVYTQEGWKLAMPYVYTQEGWKIALSYIYNSDSNWKL